MSSTKTLKVNSRVSMVTRRSRVRGIPRQVNVYALWYVEYLCDVTTFVLLLSDLP